MKRGGSVAVLTTPRVPGAIAEFVLSGNVDEVLADLVGRRIGPDGQPHHVELDGIDDGIVVVRNSGWALITPHGGPRVVQRLWQRLVMAGVSMVAADDVAPAVLFPEARDEIEALTLMTISRAASPLAVDLLLDQPRRWRDHDGTWSASDDERSRRLDRLVDPPMVVLVGPPNVGKSTLTNALAGRTWSIAHDAPGTTRDFTWGTIDLGGLVVRWHDTAGVRDAADPIEREAIERTRRLLDAADLVIAVTDAEHDWPTLAHPAPLRVATKADLGGRDDAMGSVSATTGTGVAWLTERARETLVPHHDRENPRPWRFDRRLRGPDAAPG